MLIIIDRKSEESICLIEGFELVLKILKKTEKSVERKCLKYSAKQIYL